MAERPGAAGTGSPRRQHHHAPSAAVQQAVGSSADDPELLRKQIYNQLKRSGVVASLKSQLRTQLVDQLRKLAGPDAIKGPAHAAAAAAAGGQHMHAGHKPDQTAGSIVPLAAAAGGPAAVGASAGAGAASSSMWHAAMRCMFAEYLQASGCLFTLSVFRSETDLPDVLPFTSTDLCELLRLDRQPALLAKVQQLMPHEGCLGLALLHGLSLIASGSSTADASCQTSATAQLEGISRKLMLLEDGYLGRGPRQAASGLRTLALEEHMSAYKQECDDLVEAQVAARLERLREVEVAAARQEAAAKYHSQLNAERAELERIHSERLARLAAREEEVSKRMRNQQRELDTAAYNQRQMLLAEERRLSSLRTELTRKAEIAEQTLSAKERQVDEKLRAASAREAAAEARWTDAEARLPQLQAAAKQEAEATLADQYARLKSERAAMETERAHLQELRQAVNADLAAVKAKEERVHAVESARAEAEARAAAHAAGEEVARLQLAQLQSELETLQQEVMRSDATPAAAEAPRRPAAGAGTGPLNMADALRELGQRQRRVQDVEAQLDEATVARDVALSRNDELTLALSAARREAATLRTQVTKQQQELLQLRVQAAVAGKTHRPGTAAGGSRPGSSWALRGFQQQQQQQQWLGPGSGFVSPTRYQQRQRARSVSPTAGLRSPTATAGGAGRAGIFLQHGSSPSRMAATAAGGSPQQQPQRRLAELEAAEAALAAQAEALKRRAAQQRADAARQLQDLRVAAAATGAAAATAVAAAAAAGGGVGGQSSLAGYEMWSPAVPQQQLHRQHQQQQQHTGSVAAASGGAQWTPGFNQSFVAGVVEAAADWELQQQWKYMAALEARITPQPTPVSQSLQQQQQQQHTPLQHEGAHEQLASRPQQQQQRVEQTAHSPSSPALPAAAAAAAADAEATPISSMTEVTFAQDMVCPGSSGSSSGSSGSPDSGGAGSAAAAAGGAAAAAAAPAAAMTASRSSSLSESAAAALSKLRALQQRRQQPKQAAAATADSGELADMDSQQADSGAPAAAAGDASVGDTLQNDKQRPGGMLEAERSGASVSRHRVGSSAAAGSAAAAGTAAAAAMPSAVGDDGDASSGRDSLDLGVGELRSRHGGSAVVTLPAAMAAEASIISALGVAGGTHTATDPDRCTGVDPAPSHDASAGDSAEAPRAAPAADTAAAVIAAARAAMRSRAGAASVGGQGPTWRPTLGGQGSSSMHPGSLGDNSSWGDYDPSLYEEASKGLTGLRSPAGWLSSSGTAGASSSVVAPATAAAAPAGEPAESSIGGAVSGGMGGSSNRVNAAAAAAAAAEESAGALYGNRAAAEGDAAGGVSAAAAAAVAEDNRVSSEDSLVGVAAAVDASVHERPSADSAETSDAAAAPPQPAAAAAAAEASEGSSVGIQGASSHSAGFEADLGSEGFDESAEQGSLGGGEGEAGEVTEDEVQGGGLLSAEGSSAAYGAVQQYQPYDDGVLSPGSSGGSVF